MCDRNEESQISPRDELDYIDQAVARITDDDIDAHLRKVLSQSGPGSTPPGLHDHNITASIGGLRDPALGFGELVRLASTAAAAEAAAAQQLRHSREAVEAVRQEAAQIVADAREETDTALTEAAQMLRSAREAASQMLRDARDEAAQILDNARAEAGQIIGDALSHAESIAVARPHPTERHSALNPVAAVASDAVVSTLWPINALAGTVFSSWAHPTAPPVEDLAEASGRSGSPVLATAAFLHATAASDLAGLLVAPAGVIHRDVKPSNVLLPANGLRLIDVGICRTTVEPAPGALLARDPAHSALHNPEAVASLLEALGDARAAGPVTALLTGHLAAFGLSAMTSLLDAPRDARAADRADVVIAPATRVAADNAAGRVADRGQGLALGDEVLQDGEAPGVANEFAHPGGVSFSPS